LLSKRGSKKPFFQKAQLGLKIAGTPQKRGISDLGSAKTEKTAAEAKRDYSGLPEILGIYLGKIRIFEPFFGTSRI
jgi:hypothetical protein